jgi:putative hydrolase of the HAD superfamily
MTARGRAGYFGDPLGVAEEAVVRPEREAGVPVEAVLFDLDGTLYDRDRLVRALLEEQYDAFSAELAGIARGQFVSAALTMDEHGYGDKSTGYPRLVHELGLPARLAERLVEYFWRRYDAFCELEDETRQTLETLKAHGLKLGIVTNGSVSMQTRKIEALGLEQWFDAIVISEAEGVRKPEAEIFQRAVARCSVARRAAVFVGDHPQIDVEGARDAGLRAIWKAVPYWRCVPGVPQVVRISEILSILGLAGGSGSVA